MNSHQRRVKKRKFVRWLNKDHWSAAAVAMKATLEETQRVREHVQSQLNTSLSSLFPALAAMQAGNQVWVERVYHDLDSDEVKAACPDISKILRGNCDSLTDSLRSMKADEARHLRYVFDSETNLVEVTNTLTGEKSTHVVTNLTQAAKDAIMSSSLDRPSMAFKL